MGNIFRRIKSLKTSSLQKFADVVQRNASEKINTIDFIAEVHRSKKLKNFT